MDAAAGKISAPTDCALQAILFGAFAVTTLHGTTITISSRRARPPLAILRLSPDEAPDRDQVSCSGSAAIVGLHRVIGESKHALS